jgi:hypothetical protein
MLLGDLIARLDDEQIATETLMSTGDLTLIAHVQQLASARRETVGTCITEAVAVFSQAAGPDDWMQLMSAANRSENPGGAVLRVIVSAKCTVLETSCDGARHGHT